MLEDERELGLWIVFLHDRFTPGCDRLQLEASEDVHHNLRADPPAPWQACLCIGPCDLGRGAYIVERVLCAVLERHIQEARPRMHLQQVCPVQERRTLRSHGSRDERLDAPLTVFPQTPGCVAAIEQHLLWNDVTSSI